LSRAVAKINDDEITFGLVTAIRGVTRPSH
jgi:hypothetical protein